MSGDHDINSPGQEVTIKGPHRGDIRCALLHIGADGSVFGNVIADEVRVAGRFDGTAYATRFLAADGARVNGAVNADEIGIKPKARVRAHLGPAFPAPFSFFPQAAEARTPVSEKAIRDTIDGLLAGSGMTGSARLSPPAQPPAQAAPAGLQAEAAPEPAPSAAPSAIAADVLAAEAVPAARRTLPSLV